jgi:Ca-activated chloride channel family protein
MRLILRTFLLAVSFVFILVRMNFAASAPASVKKGNSLYHQGKYDEALKYYNEAEVDIPDSDVVNFNTGAALYQRRDYEKAIEAFTKALLSDNPGIEEKSAYNIGNSKFRSGKLKENTDLASAVKFYREALDYYKRAIELNQKNTNAKYNHEFVERELKALLDKLKQQQEQSQQDSQQKQEQEQKQEQVQSATSELKQKEQERKQEEAAQEGEEKEGEQEEQAPEQAKGYEPEQEVQEEMSEEEARMILDRYNQQDQSVGNMNRGVKGRRYPPVLKDW